MPNKREAPVKTPSSSKSSTPVQASTPIKMPTPTKTTPVRIPTPSKTTPVIGPKGEGGGPPGLESALLAASIYEREMILFKATMCEQAARFDEMAETMREFCRLFDNLSVDERNTLSCAYKNVIGSRRTSWRIVNEALISNADIPTYRQRQYSHDKTSAATIARKFNPLVVRSFKTKIELEMRVHCKNILEILVKRLLPASSTTGESKVFYYKMKGDYLRYLSEISEGPERKERANESLQAYKTASDRAVIELPPTHPVRLGLMLNFSVFYYEILKSPDRACRLARQAFEDAIAELDTLSEESYRDSTIIMQLLRDNLNMWEAEKQQGTQISNDPPQQQQQ